MLFHQIAFVATAAALLVVPDVVSVNDVAPAHAFEQSVSVPCKACRGRHTQLELDFSVDDGTRLMLNGFELYPNPDPFQGELSALVTGGRGKAHIKPLGYSLAVVPEVVDRENRMELLAVELKVIEVGERFVKGVPAVELSLIKTVDGQVLIGNIALKETEPEAACRGAWCRLEALIQGVKATSRKGCHKSGGPDHGPGPHHGHGPHDKHHGHGHGAHGHGHHGHGHHGHHEHRMRLGMVLDAVLRIFALGVFGFVLGLAAGFLVRFCVFLVGLIGGARDAPTTIAEPAAADEKVALMEDEAPPEYQDEPAEV